MPLLAGGGNISIRNRLGDTALDVAFDEENERVARVLLKYWAELYSQYRPM